MRQPFSAQEKPHRSFFTTLKRGAFAIF